MNTRANLLQYEFFHVGGEGVTLEKVLAEATERTADNLALAVAGDDTGPGIKTVLRIYDTGGQVTHWAKLIQDLEAKREVHFNAPRSKSISNWYARWQIDRINKRIEQCKRLIVNYCIEHLDKSFKGEWRVARETWDHDFRPARRSEYTDLQLAASVAKSFWLFVFEPNDLLAKKNQEVVYVM